MEVPAAVAHCPALTTMTQIAALAIGSSTTRSTGHMTGDRSRGVISRSVRCTFQAHKRFYTRIYTTNRLFRN
jgi:hypothetical protein